MSYRDLPATDHLLQLPGGQSLIAEYGRERTLASLRRALDQARHRIGQGGEAPTASEIIASAENDLSRLLEPSLKPVVNATGVILHTNLGRAPLSQQALDAIKQVATHYSNLEFDLESGQRGKREQHAEEMLVELTGAEAALIVNNNAAAVLLALTALAQGLETLISRTQLIEIGGGFRIPEVLAQSGTTLVEVGTTNRTHLRDFEAALSADTGAILRAHHSNFQLVGFTSEPELSELISISQKAKVPLIDDLGSGVLLDTAAYGLAHEPMVQESLQAGASLVTFSGDKLLGGPQAGLIVGRAELVGRLRQHPLARAVRPDKLCLAALSATLDSYLRGQAEDDIPIWRMISASPEKVRIRAERWVQESGLGEIQPGESTVGGGSLPGESLPTFLWSSPAEHPDRLAASLRQMELPVIGRVNQGQLLLDPRTVLPEQDDYVITSIQTLKEIL